MKKFLIGLLIFVLSALIVLVLVNSLMANIHNVSMAEETKDWCLAITSVWKKFIGLFKN